MDCLRVKVMFICTANLCRSPLAHAILDHRAQQAGLSHAVQVASAGMHDSHAGEAPDPRAIAAAARRGYDLTGLRATAFRARDLTLFDLLLVADDGHRAHLARLAQEHERRRIRKILDFSRRHRGMDLPDPYYGGPAGFDRVIEMLEDAIDGLLKALKNAQEGRTDTNPCGPSLRQPVADLIALTD